MSKRRLRKNLKSLNDNAQFQEVLADLKKENVNISCYNKDSIEMAYKNGRKDLIQELIKYANSDELDIIINNGE